MSDLSLFTLVSFTLDLLVPADKQHLVGDLSNVVERTVKDRYNAVMVACCAEGRPQAIDVEGEDLLDGTPVRFDVEGDDGSPDMDSLAAEETASVSLEFIGRPTKPTFTSRHNSPVKKR